MNLAETVAMIARTDTAFDDLRKQLLAAGCPEDGIEDLMISKALVSLLDKYGQRVAVSKLLIATSFANSETASAIGHALEPTDKMS